MTVPLVLLAAAACSPGWIGVPKLFGFLPDISARRVWLKPVLGLEAAEARLDIRPGLELAADAASVAVAGCGIALAWFLYRRRRPKGKPLEAAGWLYRGSLKQMEVDEAYDSCSWTGWQGRRERAWRVSTTRSWMAA